MKIGSIFPKITTSSLFSGAKKQEQLKADQAPSANSAALLKLPTEILSAILPQLSSSDCSNLARTSKLANTTVNDPSHWNRHLKFDYHTANGSEGRKKFFTDINARKGVIYDDIRGIRGALSTHPDSAIDTLIKSAKNNLEVIKTILERKDLRDLRDLLGKLSSENLVEITQCNPKFAEIIAGQKDFLQKLESRHVLKITEFYPMFPKIIIESEREKLFQKLDYFNLLGIEKYPELAALIAERKDLLQKLNKYALKAIAQSQLKAAEIIFKTKDLLQKLHGYDLVDITRSFPQLTTSILEKKDFREKLFVDDLIEIAERDPKFAKIILEKKDLRKKLEDFRQVVIAQNDPMRARSILEPVHKLLNLRG